MKKITYLLLFVFVSLFMIGVNARVESRAFTFNNVGEEEEFLRDAVYELQNMDGKTFFRFNNKGSLYFYSKYLTMDTFSNKKVMELFSEDQKNIINSVKTLDDIDTLKEKMIVALEEESDSCHSVYVLIPFKIIATKASLGYEKERAIVYLGINLHFYFDEERNVQSIYVYDILPNFIDLEDYEYNTIYEYNENINYSQVNSLEKISSCKDGDLTCELFIVNHKKVEEDKGSVYISNLSCTNISDGEDNDDFETYVFGLSIDTSDTLFYKKGDSLKCTIEITNNDSETVRVDQEYISRMSNEYISYNLNSDGGNVIEPGKVKKYVLDVNYLKEYESNREIDSNLQIKLVSNVINPDTKVGLGIVVGALLTSIVVLIIKRAPGKYVALLLVIGSMIMIPTVHALISATITLNNRILIQGSGYHVFYQYSTYISEDEIDNYYSFEKMSEEVFTFEGSEYYFGVITIDSGVHKVGENIAINRYYGSFCGSGVHDGICDDIFTERIGEWRYYDQDLKFSEYEYRDDFVMPNMDVIFRAAEKK